MLELIAQFGSGIEPPTDAFSEGSAADASGTAAAQNLETLLSNMIGVLTVVAGIAFIIYFLLGALNWVTAGGDSSKLQKARDRMVMGTIGLVVIVMAYAIIGLIGTVIGLDLLQPGALLLQLDPTP